MTNDALLEIKDLHISFPLDEGMVRAVRGASLTIRRGEVLGVVGESGCGKTVTAQSVLRIIPPPGRIESGQILFHRAKAANGRPNEIVDIAKLNPSGREIRAIRGRDIAMIFQEPMSSLSPVHTIGNQLVEAIQLHEDVTKDAARKRVIELMRLVGISGAEQRIDSYPHQFSGGMRQRVMIAMALSCSPALLIADEPTTALDVTIQAQILSLVRDLQKRLGMAVMFITHNLGVIAQTADNVAIMYLGQVVEYGPVREILRNPKHPYTIELLRAVPRLGKTMGQRLAAIEGGIPSPFQHPKGCPFHPRCTRYMAGLCDASMPVVTPIAGDHMVRCFLYEAADGAPARTAA